MWYNLAWFLAGVGFTIAVETVTVCLLVWCADKHTPGDS